MFSESERGKDQVIYDISVHDWGWRFCEQELILWKYLSEDDIRQGAELARQRAVVGHTHKIFKISYRI
jgi:hypothetical protein